MRVEQLKKIYLTMESEQHIEDPCYVHTVAFRDVGLVWSHKRRRGLIAQAAALAEPADGGEAEQEEVTDEREELGLPTTFGTLKTQPAASKRAAQGYGAEWQPQRTTEPARPTPSPPAPQDPPAWQQALDAATGHFYYYCEAQQLTQWEPPEEGFAPAPDAWWLPRHASVEREGTEEAEAEEERRSLVSSHYDLAVASYKAHHGWEGEEQAAIGVSEEDEAEQVGEERQRQRPRMESSGLLPGGIPEPRGQHIRFASSGEEEEEAELEALSLGAAAADLQEGLELLAMETDAGDGEGEQPSKEKRKKKKARSRRGGGMPADVPARLHKYWLQRYSLFSRYDDGIIIDEEGWFSATPEVVAWHHAKRAVSALNGAAPGGCVAVDAFAGVGGNAIQLALTGCHVIAVEMDPARAAIVAHNAAVYGVHHLVEVVCADFLKVGPGIRADVVLLSPPWGGPEYSQCEVFDADEMGGRPELGLGRLLRLAFEEIGCKAALAWLPRNSKVEGLQAAAAGVGLQGGCEVERCTLNGVLKGMTVYYGTAARPGKQ